MRVVGHGLVLQEQQAPSHPEVDQENPTRFEPNNQILSATLERLDPLPCELGGDLPRIEGRVSAGLDLHSLEGATDEMRLEADPDRLDLRQLRHGRSVAVDGSV